jgi:hypothetical protein
MKLFHGPACLEVSAEGSDSGRALAKAALGDTLCLLPVSVSFSFYGGTISAQEGKGSLKREALVSAWESQVKAPEPSKPPGTSSEFFFFPGDTGV